MVKLFCLQKWERKERQNTESQSIPKLLTKTHSLPRFTVLVLASHWRY